MEKQKSTRKPYRKRTKKAVKKTPAERKLLAAQRSEQREKMADALAAARDTVAEEARKLQSEFGAHDQKYYEHQILQSSRVAGTRRKTNAWNAYLRNELAKLNASEFPAMCHVCFFER